MRMYPWYACTEPERPPDAAICWHYHNCHGCKVKADAPPRQYPDDPHVAWVNAVMAEATA